WARAGEGTTESRNPAIPVKVLIVNTQPGTTETREIPVRGRVVSLVDNTGLPGVTVVEKGTNNGTVTNLNGEYSIEVEGENSVLVFSYVGFDTQEVTVGSRNEINISMSESIDNLNEVVVTALGIEREQRSLGYDVANVSGEDLTQ